MKSQGNRAARPRHAAGRPRVVDPHRGLPADGGEGLCRVRRHSRPVTRVGRRSPARSPTPTPAAGAESGHAAGTPRLGSTRDRRSSDSGRAPRAAATAYSSAPATSRLSSHDSEGRDPLVGQKVNPASGWVSPPTSRAAGMLTSCTRSTWPRTWSSAAVRSAALGVWGSPRLRPGPGAGGHPHRPARHRDRCAALKPTASAATWRS